MSTHRFTRRAVTVGATALAAISFLVGSAAPASAQKTDATGSADQSRSIVATGTSRVRGTPDVLTVQVGATSRGHTVGEALDRNNAAVRKVIAALVDGGVDKKDIQTTNLSVGPIYGDNGNDIQGYQVSNVVVAHLRDLEKAGSLLDEAVQAGGDDVVLRGVSFDIDDTSDLVAAARVDAVKRARNQAEQLAAAAGVQLGDVMTISESSRDVGPVVSAPDAAASTSVERLVIQSGSQELTVQVSVVFSIR
ncbi:MAG TPA: SIMPL domain-containing protein [Acidimicrobiia bacterium]|nr:SIMPL domain-containing protein [Acidimicrobiia bacterium]